MVSFMPFSTSSLVYYISEGNTCYTLTPHICLRGAVTTCIHMKHMSGKINKSFKFDLKLNNKEEQIITITY